MKINKKILRKIIWGLITAGVLLLIGLIAKLTTPDEMSYLTEPDLLRKVGVAEVKLICE